MGIINKIRDRLAGGEWSREDGNTDISECSVRIFDDPRIGKTLRSHLGFTGKLAEVWRKPNEDETFVLETPHGRTYWANVEIEIID